MVNFEEHFWGEKYTGFDVLQQNFKHGFNASKEFSEFLKERSSIEETYSKSLLKLATKCSAANSQVGCFEPCWKFLQSSTEKLANVHTQVIQHFNDVSKSCRDYGEQHKEKQKQLRDEFTATSEAVVGVQTLSTALIKAKESYQQKSAEVEKYRKEFTSLRDIKNAELKFKKSSEDYKQIVEKREAGRKKFHEKMTAIAKKLQTEEEEHLIKMLEILSNYGETIKTQRVLLEQIIDEFSRNLLALTVENLLQQFINLKQTGKEVPVQINFEEVEMKTAPVDLDEIAQAIKEDKKKKKAEKRLKKAEKIETRKKKKDKTTDVNGSVEKTDQNIDLENELQLDEEGYVIRSPAETASLHSERFSKDSFSSDSDSDSEDERSKIQVRIKPVEESKGSNSDLSEEQLKKLSATLTLMSPASMQDKSTKQNDDKKFVSIWGSHSSLNNLKSKSRSNNDLLSIDKQSSDTASLHSLPINSAISGLDTPSGIDTPSSARSSQENNAAFPRNNSEPSVSISPLASPDFTSSLPSSARMSPVQNLDITGESNDTPSKNLEEPPPLPTKSRQGTLSSDSSDKSSDGSKKSLDESSIDSTLKFNVGADSFAAETLAAFDTIKPTHNEGRSTLKASFTPASNKEIADITNSKIKMFSNELFDADFPSEGTQSSSEVTQSSLELPSNDVKSRTASESSITPTIMPPPAIEKRTSSSNIQPLPPPARAAPRSSSSLPRPKAGQIPPSLPSRSGTLPAHPSSTTSNAFSDLLDINFSSTVPPLSPIRDKPSQETVENTTSHWVNPETLEDSNEFLPTKSKSQLNDDASSPPAVPRREAVPTQTSASTTATMTSIPTNERAIPIAVAFIETVNGLFKGADDKSCVVRVTGDMTISFPSHIIQMLATNPSPPVLSFLVSGTSSLEQIIPNKALVERGGQLAGGEGITFKFNMTALAAYLKKQAERGAKASYYNIDILKYQVRCQGMVSAPLQVSSYWRCDEEETDLRIDYQYNSSCMSPTTSLSNVSFVVPIDGGVTIMQSKPTAIWSSEHQRCMWKLAAISSSLDNSGFNSLRARFNLSRGPSVPAPIAVQFTGEGSTISLLNFELTSSAYKLSLVKKRFTSGKYILEQLP